MTSDHINTLLADLLGPVDAAGTLPAFIKFAKWVDIWQSHSASNSLAIELSEKLADAIDFLKRQDDFYFNNFPAPKKHGDNPYLGRLLTKSPVWGLTPINHTEEGQQKSFDEIAAAFLYWTVRSGRRHVKINAYRDWLKNPQNENPIGPLLKSLEQTGLAIRRLASRGDTDLLRSVAIACWSPEKTAFHELIFSYSLEDDNHGHLMRIRSLHWLVNGHRRLSNRSSSTSHIERTRGVINSSRKKYVHSFILDVDDSQTTFFTPVQPADDVLGEDRSSLSLLSLSLDDIKKSLLESGLQDQDINFKALYARAKSMAKHLSRSNQLHQLDTRRLHVSELAQLDKILTDEAISLEARASLFFPLLTGRRWKNLSKLPAQLECSGANEIVLRTLTNRPKITPHPECLGTDADVLLPIPRRWQVLAKALMARFPSTDKFRHQDVESNLAKLLKTCPESPSLSPSKISKELAFSLFDTVHDEAIPALICDHLTPISTTKNHYVVVEKNRASQWAKAAWEKREAFLPMPQGVPSLPAQRGHIGTHGHPDRELMQHWLHEAPFEKESTSSKQLLARQYLMKEAFFLAHRGVSDPGYLLKSAPNRDLGSTMVLLNDKNRGGQHQMVRLALLPAAAASALKTFEAKNEEQVQGRHWYYAPHARTPYGDIGKTIRPQQLTDDEPAAPSPANGSRKMFRSVAVGKVPGELADAIMGWHSHGTVPFSEFSALSPFMMQASMKGFTQGLFSFFESSRLEIPHESDA